MRVRERESNREREKERETEREREMCVRVRSGPSCGDKKKRPHKLCDTCAWIGKDPAI